MISVMIVHDFDLLRGALAALLSNEEDLEIAAQVAAAEDPVTVARDKRPDVVVMHVERSDPDGLELPRRLTTEAGCRVLLICGWQPADAVTHALEAGIAGLLGTDAAPVLLVDAVRRIAHHERVIDPMLLNAALHRAVNPLTDRQRAVLRLAAEGLTARDIGRRLFLAPGTVRNYLSAAVRRAGGRSVLEAAGLARTRGWL